MPRRKFPEPTDAKAIFDMTFKVISFHPKSYNATISIEFPLTKKRTEYVTLSATSFTKNGALRAVIRELESKPWFHTMRQLGARFRVSGEGMDTVYRGYL